MFWGRNGPELDMDTWHNVSNVSKLKKKKRKKEKEIRKVKQKGGKKEIFGTKPAVRERKGASKREKRGVERETPSSL